MATTETFSVTSQNVGVVKGLKVWLEGCNQGERWMVMELCLACPHSEEVLHFPCGQWVGPEPPHELRPVEPLSSTTGAGSSLTASGPASRGTESSLICKYCYPYCDVNMICVAT